jgi:hypothetical protein
MLHFLIGTAVCIWIAERVTHYWGEWRWRRQQRRYVRWLQGEDIRSGLPPWVKLSPKPVFQSEPRPDAVLPPPPVVTPRSPVYDPEPWLKGCAVIPLWAQR